MTKQKRLTERQAAVLLIDQWLCGFTNPLFQDPDEMTSNLSSFSYKVTEKRAEKIKEHVRNITEPFEESIREQVEKI